MLHSLHGPQQLKDRKVQTRVHRQRDEFIAAIHEDDVCRLASSHHGGDHCSFFKPPIRGSYNICYFVHFPNVCSILLTYRRQDPKQSQENRESRKCDESYSIGGAAKATASFAPFFRLVIKTTTYISAALRTLPVQLR